MKRTLRPYQDDAVSCIRRELEQVDSTLLVLPTGTGKTVVMSRIAADWPHGRVLLLAHRTELLEQAADKLAPELERRPAIEQAGQGIEINGHGLDVDHKVLVGSVATMRGARRLKKFRDWPVGLLMIDEAHHATAQSYRTIVDHFRGLNPGLKVLGVTATPRRTDKVRLQGTFDSVAYEYPLRDAIRDGYLVPVRNRVVEVEGVDFSNVRMAKNELGEMDFRRDDLEAILTEEGPLHALAEPLLREAAGKPCVVFCAGVPHAHMLSMILARGTAGHPGATARAIDGNTDPDERRKALREFAAGELKFLCNFGIFTEGWDCPSASVVGMCRMTKSVLLFLQMLGRVLRPADSAPGRSVVDGIDTAEGRRAAIAASGKPYALSIDCVGVSANARCVTSEDALGGDLDPAVKRLAQEIAGERAAPVDENLAKARSLMVLLEEEQRRKYIKAQVTYRAEEVDVFGGAGGVAARVPDGIGRGGSTDKQIAFLVNLGVAHATAAGYTARQAGAVIDSLTATRCTVKQQRLLRKYGLDPDVPYAEARRLIDAIAANGWRLPRGVAT